jgi:hypothetical protein
LKTHRAGDWSDRARLLLARTGSTRVLNADDTGALAAAIGRVGSFCVGAGGLMRAGFPSAGSPRISIRPTVRAAP